MNDLAPFSKYRFLILGGTSKAGTTAVYNYLAHHPQICSLTKETRFFLDADYPLSSTKRYQRDSPETYLSFFDSENARSPQNWRFEATPDYLYSPTTPRAIRKMIANISFIFILREPISRLISWYRFGQAMNEIPSKTTFDEYIAVQKEIGDSFPDGYRHPAFGALRHGRYSIYLKRFVEVFGTSSMQILFYEELQRDPLSCLMSICKFAGLESTYFRNYSFSVMNKSVQVRSPRLHRAYFEAREKARLLFRDRPRTRSLLRGMGRRVNAWYRRMNITKGAEIEMSRSTRDFISGYYEEEPARLKGLFGIDVPWPKYSSREGVSTPALRAGVEEERV
jgi:hypothetical protein